MRDSLCDKSCLWRETIHGDGAKVVDEVVVNQPRRSNERWVSLTATARKVSNYNRVKLDLVEGGGTHRASAYL